MYVYEANNVVVAVVQTTDDVCQPRNYMGVPIPRLL